MKAYGGRSGPQEDAPEPHGPSGPPEPGASAAPEEEDEEEGGEEGGVKRISATMRQFNRALAQKNFDEARKHLGKAQRGIQKANEVTRSHPDFEDIEQLVIAARPRLEAAVETDRIERRNAAIDALMRRAESAAAAANGMHAELSQRVPTEEDIGRLDELLAAFAEMKSEGAQYLDESRYAAHAKVRDERAGELAAVRKLTRWRLDATAAIAAPLGNGYEAAVAAKEQQELREQVRLYSQADSGFRACAQTITDLAADPLFRPTYQLKSRLGVRSFEETKRGCLDLARQARAQADALTWEADVADVLASIKTPMSALRGSGSAEEEQKAARAAAEALSKCMHELEATERKPGFDAGRSFDTAFGKMSATALRGACKGERDRIIKSLPSLEWRTTLTPMLDRLAEAKGKAGEAAGTKESAALVELWTAALGGYRECVERAKKAQKAPGADRDLPLESAAGEIDIVGIEKLCAREAESSERALAAAIKRREVEDFAATCRGDEKEVVDREGIPSRIDSFNDGRLYVGRIFIYEKPGAKGNSELRRFAFDQTGKRVDYWVDWRNQVVQVIAELGRVLSAVKKARDAGEQVKAVEAALPILDVCREVLGAGQKSPGFDGKSSFETPLGKLTVPSLIPACSKEKDKLQAGLVALGWHARLEGLAKRLDEAAAQLDKAQKLESAGERLEILGSVLGSLAECSEHAAVLPGQPGANRKLEVKSVKGVFNVGSIGKACSKLGREAQAVADAALVQKKLEEFLSGCNGDEVAVARREGVPDKIEEGGAGRIFVYGGKKKKRFAFDAAGKRVDEKLLGAK